MLEFSTDWTVGKSSPLGVAFTQTSTLSALDWSAQLHSCTISTPEGALVALQANVPANTLECATRLRLFVWIFPFAYNTFSVRFIGSGLTVQVKVFVFYSVCFSLFVRANRAAVTKKYTNVFISFPGLILVWKGKQFKTIFIFGGILSFMDEWLLLKTNFSHIYKEVFNT